MEKGGFRRTQRRKKQVAKPERRNHVVLRVQIARAHSTHAKVQMLIRIKSNSSRHRFIAVEILHAVGAAVILYGYDVIEFAQPAIKLNPGAVTPNVGHRMRDER